MALQTKTVKTSSLKAYERNPRKNDAAVDRMVAAIQEFGFRIPIVAKSDGTVVDGHLRLKAAVKMGLDTVPVALADDLSDAQVRAFRLLANKSANWAEWDDAILSDELKALGAEGFDLALTGFDDIELVSFLSGNDGITDPDEVPEAPAVPTSRLGDLWVCGNHRVLCGDSTSAEAVASLLGSVKPHLMVTDPPYGVEYDASWRAKAGVNKNKAKMGKVLNDDRADWRAAWALFPGEVAYVWHASLFTREVLDSLEACGFKRRSMIIWAKDRFTLGRADYHWQHEPCWYVVRDGKTGHYVGGRSQSTVWNIAARDDSGVGHSTQKPVECMRRPIINNSSAGQAVYDPFLGSGTTMIAAEMEGRHCFGMELSPTYVDVIVQRWMAFTGKQAALDGDGSTFGDIAASRQSLNPVTP